MPTRSKFVESFHSGVKGEFGGRASPFEWDMQEAGSRQGVGSLGNRIWKRFQISMKAIGSLLGRGLIETIFVNHPYSV